LDLNIPDNEEFVPHLHLSRIRSWFCEDRVQLCPNTLRNAFNLSFRFRALSYMATHIIPSEIAIGTEGTYEEWSLSHIWCRSEMCHQVLLEVRLGFTQPSARWIGTHLIFAVFDVNSVLRPELFDLFSV